MTPSTALGAIAHVGRYGLLLAQAFRSVHEWRTYRANLFVQAVRIGIDSLPIVVVAAAFSGAVTTLQTAYQFVSGLVPKSVIGSIVTESVILELAPVISALVLAGRVGARIAAELGTMRVTEQIDALEVMGLNAVSFLVLPRVLAGVLMFPVLITAAAVVGIAGGIVAGVTSGELPAAEFLVGARSFFKPFDVTFMLTKAVTFGFLVSSISCYQGYYASGGAEGVGRATTRAAVISCITVLLADYILAALLL
ncbi:MAG: ABC transporter permease [Bacteroidetes bacterium]|nr:ABC transporter permease [Rhodothermia bacterium]MCS7154330.1 ABC transporter permease [Bacteroidota bacterium]MCX7906633.1 ABC transporter permease [Bacteroidota bacterium]MDW8137086.1 ABC transporter permease [Bacteroidota bacterium]MDW8285043.1 ABC transporter permease [Bacteroidota bacterium]